MTGLCGCGRKLTNLCLLKKNESRFVLLSACCYWFYPLAACLHWLLSLCFSLLQEREKEYEESLAQNTERVVRCVQLNSSVYFINPFISMNFQISFSKNWKGKRLGIKALLDSFSLKENASRLWVRHSKPHFFTWIVLVEKCSFDSVVGISCEKGLVKQVGSENCSKISVLMALLLRNWTLLLNVWSLKR